MKNIFAGRFGSGARGAVVGSLLAGGVAGILYWVGTYVVPVITSSPIYEIAIAGGATAGALGILTSTTQKREHQ